MKTTNFKSNSMFETLFIMAFSAIVGGVIAVIVALPAAIAAVAFMGPVVWFTVGPILLAAASASIMWAIIGVPIWAIIGGFLFANMLSGNGRASRQNNVTFFSSTHPIAKRTNELAEKLALPNIPYIGWYEEKNINAFAMGTRLDNTLIAFSKGAIEKLSTEELDAVIGHELAHVANQDMYRMTFLRGAQEALTFFLIFRSAKKIARWVFTPLSELYILKFSREREFEADNIAAQLTSPNDMTAALIAIQNQKHLNNQPDPYANTRISGWNTEGLFSTHPPLTKRIETLSYF
ncbi:MULTISPECIES: M48 family metalloprotease [unclassified Lentilitoribacter]|jgi:heat shock protein HtpX|uniref:M48 family metalloprotease n=1 Tax=unclassified Lentilitoribacter TaxID=2647570 RepID=UPI0013A6B7BA|nr:M48 family metalloprotease [Lentilitoribacter sp. Alg239-R112]